MRKIFPLIFAVIISGEAVALTDSEKSSIKMEAEIVGGWLYCSASLAGMNSQAADFLMAEAENSNRNARSRFAGEGFSHYMKMQQKVLETGYSDYEGGNITMSTCTGILQAKGF